MQNGSAIDKKKAQNLRLNHFVEDKSTGNFVILFRTEPRKTKMFRILFGTIRRREKLSNEPLSKRKNCLKLIGNHSRTKKNTQMTFKNIFWQNSVLYCFKPRNGLTRETQNSAKEALFPQNKKKRSESIPQNIFGTNFDGNPRSVPLFTGVA